MTDHIYIEPIGGISGDMFVSAIMDATHTSQTDIESALKKIQIPKSLSVNYRDKKDSRMSGKCFSVDGPLAGPRNFQEITNFIEQSKISHIVKNTAVSIFQILAVAEAKVHGVDVAHVHFHEVGNWDSLIDIYLAAHLISRVGDCEWTSSSIPVGEGFVNCEHGLIPIPAPATMEILKGMELRHDGIKGERTTPTGAAILRHLSPSFKNNFENRKLTDIGVGFGGNSFKCFSNVLRLSFYDNVESLDFDDDVGIINFTIDDQTPEDLSYGLERIRKTASVLDVVQTQSFGKKNRIVSQILVLCEPFSIQSVSTACLKYTSTIGLRLRVEKRKTLPRKEEKITVDNNIIRTKTVHRPGGLDTSKAESDDIDKLELSYAEREELRYRASKIYQRLKHND